MKRIKCLSILLAAILLAGCAAVENRDAAPFQAGDSGAAASVAGSMVSTQTERGSRTLSEEEVLAAYERAVNAYGWFERSTLPSSGPSVNMDGRSYQRVEYVGIGSEEDLRTYLRSIFADSVVSRLLPQDGTGLYRDIDGALYVQARSREQDSGKGKVAAVVEQRSETAYCVNVTVELLDGEGSVAGVECYAFPYEQTGGRWVFTDFELVN